MNYNFEKHHRRSIRLKGFDYSQEGAYFVTVCAWNRECLFGEIKNGETMLNEFGEIAMKYWDAIPCHFPYVATDEFVIMPNHIHGIVINVGAQFIAPFRKTTAEKQGVMKKGVINQAPTKNNDLNPDVINEGVINIAPTENNGNNPDVVNQGVINHAPTVGKIVRTFKARCTHAINQIRNSPGIPVWQRNYYEHIIRDENELNRIRGYIINNPLQWTDDENNPANIKAVK